MFWCSAYNVFEIGAHNSVVIPVLLLIFIVVQSEEKLLFLFSDDRSFHSRRSGQTC